MVGYNVIGKMGSGKTLFSTYYACVFRQENPNAPIYANYRLKLPNFHYIPYLIFSYTEVKKSQTSLIIVDDLASYEKILDNFLRFSASLSRKTETDIILISQYYTMVNKNLRALSNYQVEVNYIEKKDMLEVVLIDQENEIFPFEIKNIVKTIGNYYDTFEIVDLTNERMIKDEIGKKCINYQDLEYATRMYFGSNKRHMDKITDEIAAKKKFAFVNT